MADDPQFSSIPAAVEAIRLGKVVIVLDDEGRAARSPQEVADIQLRYFAKIEGGETMTRKTWWIVTTLQPTRLRRFINSCTT